MAAGKRSFRSPPAPLPPAPVLAALATFFAAADLAIPFAKLPPDERRYALSRLIIQTLKAQKELAI